MHNLGFFQEKRGDLAGAEESYLAVLRAEPGFATAFFSLGFLQEERGDLAGAEEIYLAAVRAEPGDANALFILGKVGTQIQDKSRLHTA